MLDWSECTAVERIPGKGGGEWLFKHTRVPVRALFENLEGGARSMTFLNGFRASRESRSKRCCVTPSGVWLWRKGGFGVTGAWPGSFLKQPSRAYAAT